MQCIKESFVLPLHFFTLFVLHLLSLLHWVRRDGPCCVLSHSPLTPSLGGQTTTCISRTELSQKAFFFKINNCVDLWMVLLSSRRLFNQRRKLSTSLLSMSSPNFPLSMSSDMGQIHPLDHKTWSVQLCPAVSSYRHNLVSYLNEPKFLLQYNHFVFRYT